VSPQAVQNIDVKKYTRLIRQNAKCGDGNRNSPAVIVYPNPASDYVVFQLSGNRGESYELLIFNTLGHICKNHRFLGGRFRLDRNGLPDGLYHFKIRSLKNELVAKGKLIFE